MAQSMAASGSWGLPAEEHAPLDIDFYHRSNGFLPPWKLILTTLESFSFLLWKRTHHFNILQGNKEAQCNRIKAF